MDFSFAGVLGSLFPEEVVSFATEVREEHAADKWFARRLPDAVVFARDTQDVATLMRWANETGVPVTPRGAGYGYVGGCVPESGGVVLSLARMNRIKEINGADFVAVVEPGVITGHLQEQAKALGLYYPPDPASLANCSLGGNVAANAGGPRCLKYGVTRHYVLGLEVVLPTGEILRTGGRCHKNKTGFDLTGLFVGSEGLLGIVTEITLRLLPHPAARAMLSAGFPDFAAAAAGVQAVLQAGFLPAALEITDAFTLEAARNFRGENLAPGCQAHLLVELDGQAESVRRELDTVADVVRGAGARHVEKALEEEECAAIWSLRRDFSMSLKASGMTKLNEDVVVPRGRLVDLVNFAAQLQEESGFPVACFGHAGDGNIHTNIMVPDMKDPEMAARAEVVLDKLFHQVLAWGGAITGEHGIGIAKRRWFSQAVSPVSLALHRGLKALVDPGGVLNPGKFLVDHKEGESPWRE